MILRVNMQFQAAAYASLEILQGKEVDRVYCDYHDDFVVRYRIKEGLKYHFYQVKTKGKANHQWGLLDVFSLKKTKQNSDPESLEKIKNSFAGKLLTHSIVFGDSCRKVTLLSNVHFDDDVENVTKELNSGNFSSKHAKLLFEHFDSIFNLNPASDEVKKKNIVAKFSLLPSVSYIGDEDQFTSAARTAIYKYSEIDLDFQEISEIAAGLISLVNKKSHQKLDASTPEAFDSTTGIGIEDLLAILSISTEAYQALISGNDPAALKTASVIQRKLKAAGATDQMIEYCSQQKVNWDIWLRNARHTYLEFDLNFLLEYIDNLCANWLKSGGDLALLSTKINTSIEEVQVKQFATLEKEVFFGGVIAAIVKRGTK